ncbi:hypothetical protein Tco_1429390 [Tanacetum coccineum]
MRSSEEEFNPIDILTKVRIIMGENAQGATCFHWLKLSIWIMLDWGGLFLDMDHDESEWFWGIGEVALITYRCVAMVFVRRLSLNEDDCDDDD